jgi:hypothetical protein
MDITKIGGAEWKNLAAQTSKPQPSKASETHKFFYDARKIEQSTEINSMLSLKREKSMRQFAK